MTSMAAMVNEEVGNSLFSVSVFTCFKLNLLMTRLLLPELDSILLTFIPKNRRVNQKINTMSLTFYCRVFCDDAVGENLE